MPREEEAKVTCPKCGAETKVPYFKHDVQMCGTCWSYLAPGAAAGKDYGHYMVRTRKDFEGFRTMEIRPRGFWSDTISVTERTGWNEKNSVVIEIRWSTGGTDGSLSPLTEAKRFAEALDFAIFTAEVHWKAEREEQGLKVIC